MAFLAPTVSLQATLTNTTSRDPNAPSRSIDNGASQTYTPFLILNNLPILNSRDTLSSDIKRLLEHPLNFA